ncbi:TRPM [Cordylochernes scorpioides]|uniref:TRPM n=1 Tax=Cordylochernes scorpioides TaxID=51811 RepID=A0ABY6KKN1_9ARAC|nr:TRPM [Cordylochernes scorpioides]
MLVVVRGIRAVELGVKISSLADGSWTKIISLFATQKKQVGEKIFFSCFDDVCVSQGRPFLRLTHDVNMEDVARVMAKEWALRTPRIALVVITNVAPLTSWQNTRSWKPCRRESSRSR